MWVSPEVRLTDPSLWRALDGPARFGDLLDLVGYRLSAESATPGDVVELVTLWRAKDTVEAEDDWNTFVHLLDVESRVIGGVDVLRCPPTGWRPGDVVVQVHRFQVAGSAPRGQDAFLEIGVYRHSAGRQPVIVDERPAGDRVLLQAMRVR